MTQRPRRGLAAIMFADIVGFTALMGEDENAARAARDRQRDVLGRLVGQFGGEVRQYYGDGTLSTFASAVEAARCAIAIQRELATPPRVSIRIGIHVGDIAEAGDGVYGDGVNVAARLEAFAPPGGVVVSSRVFDEIRNQRDLDAVSMGPVHLKNVARPVELFTLVGEGLPAPEAHAIPEVPEAPRVTTLDAAPLGKPLFIGAVALAVALFGGSWLFSALAGPETSEAVSADRPTRALPSIAVIPFRSLSAGDDDDGFFADGLHDDILTQLAKIRSLEVIARTSVMRYADTEMPVPEIGRELGVATVLEGGVQRAGTRIRLNVQLIDGRTDAHLWAETYDRELTTENIFAIQSELADSIARKLRAVLTGDERQALAAVPTKSVEAYDHYLRGSVALRRDAGSAELAEAWAALDSAVASDPGFVMAWARLAYVHLDYYWNAFDRSDDRLAMATHAIERAEALDPGDPEVLLQTGYYRYWGFREYGAALEAFDAAQRGLPGDARVHEARAYVLRRMGRWDEAIRELERAVSLDPLNAEMVRALGQMHMQTRDYGRAEEYVARARAIQPDRWTPRYDYALIGMLRDGDLARAEELMAQPDPNDVHRYLRWLIAYSEGDDRVAFSTSDSLAAPLEQQASVHTKALMDALMHERQGRTEQARESAEVARRELEAMVREAPDDPRPHAALGTALALLGRRDAALAEGREAVRLLPVSTDAVDGPEYLLHLARIQVLLGEDDEAVETLTRLLSRPSGNSLASVLLDPTFAPLRDHPGLANFGGS